MNRKSFLRNTTAGLGGFIMAPGIILSQDTANVIDPLPADLVKEFVIAGHGNFQKVKEMLGVTPALLYAAWDWGGGDFETALEGAGHTGNKEIANYLIGFGARTNLFVLTMLGKTALVKSHLNLFPAYISARGPHGLTLLHHAQKGGDEAKELLNWLQYKGLKETKQPL